MLPSSLKPPLTFVTGNMNKLREVQEMLGGQVPLVMLKLDLPEYQGDSRTISAEKCKLAAKQVNGPVITEDTCLGFHALKGLPGPYIKWFLEKLGHEGLNQLLSSYTDKSAFALCTLAYCEGPGEEPILFEGQTEGQLVSPRSSSSKSSTFGWDPIFQPQGFSLTYAEMPSSLKHTLSHRSKALTLLKSFLQHHPTFSEFMNQPTPTHSPHHPSLNT